MRHKIVNHEITEKVRAAKGLIKAAFAELRKAGFIARSNFMCCMSCASYDLSEMATKKSIEKVVYWHHQDETNFKEKGKLDIRYYSMKDDESEGVKVGHEIVETLRRHGLNVTWSGDCNETIQLQA